VNLFIASEVRWPEKGLTVRQTTRFPEPEGISISVKAEKPVQAAINIRIPSWAVDGGSVCGSEGQRDHYSEIGGRNSRGVLGVTREGAAAYFQDCRPESCDDADSAESSLWGTLHGVLENEHAKRRCGGVGSIFSARGIFRGSS
jgi:hypothetical protein